MYEAKLLKCSKLNNCSAARRVALVTIDGAVNIIITMAVDNLLTVLFTLRLRAVVNDNNGVS